MQHQVHCNISKSYYILSETPAVVLPTRKECEQILYVYLLIKDNRRLLQ